MLGCHLCERSLKPIPLTVIFILLWCQRKNSFHKYPLIIKTMGVFNKEWNNQVDCVVSWCDIRPLDYKTGKVFHTNKAMWDTGATTTVISNRIVHQLKLQPFNTSGISGISGVSEANTYLVHISLPTGDTYTFLEVIESDSCQRTCCSEIKPWSSIKNPSLGFYLYLKKCFAMVMACRIKEI